MIRPERSLIENRPLGLRADGLTIKVIRLKGLVFQILNTFYHFDTLDFLLVYTFLNGPSHRCG